MAHVNVKVSADSAGVQTGLAQAQEHINHFKETAKESFADVGKDFAGIFAVGFILEGLHSIFEQLERVDKLAQRFGETAETMQRVGEAAKLNGTDIETVAKAMTKVTVIAVEAGKKGGELAEAFKTLGISAGEFADLPLEEKLAALSEGFDRNTSNAIKADAAQKILGKSAGELEPLLKRGGDELRREFASANVASNETVEKIADANERIIKTFDTIKTYGAEAIGFVIKTLDTLTEAVAVFFTFLGNLPKGFKAASAEADRLAASYRQLHKEDADKKEANKGAEKKTAQIQAEQQAKAEQAKKEEQAAKELEQLQEQNDAKKEEARQRHLTLLQKEHELQGKIIGLAKDDKGGSESDRLKRDNTRLDLAKDLEKVQDEIRKASLKKAKETAKEKAKAELDAEKQKLSEGEQLLKGMEDKFKKISVDSLKSVGGSLSRVNYNSVLPKQDAAKEALEHQKKAVDELKKIVKNTETKNKLFTDGDGSFAA